MNYLKNAGLPSTSATVSVSNLTHPGTDCTAATELDQLQIAISLPFTAVRQWSAATLVTSSTTNLTATAIFYSNIGQSYPTSISMPQAY